MTRLLVSVRNRSEALTALEAGADLLDIKEPLRGSLGSADAATIAEIAQSVAGRIPISAAFGELTAWNDAIDMRFDEAVPQVSFAKIGLANCAFVQDWQIRWRQFVGRLPENIGRVAVVYADASARAPAAVEIVAHAIRLQCRAVLIDTFDKRTGPLTHHWSSGRIHSSILEIQAHGMLAVLAGGLNALAMQALLPLAPDYFAVRGAICTSGDRTGTLCAERIRRLKEIIRGASGSWETDRDRMFA
jgi:uncharacterized protein (UPF0264 family)